jgi:DNA-binding MarR family transcriptional regulator
VGRAKLALAAETQGAPAPAFEAPFKWDMVYLLARTFYEVRDRTDATLKPFNLTPMQFTILASLGRWEGLNSAELSRRFNVTPQSMGEMVGNLERRGLVVRRSDPDNRRALKLELTNKGRGLVETCTAGMRKLEMELFSAFSPDELHDLRERLITLHEHLGLKAL